MKTHVFLIFLLLGAATLPAREIATYQLGDTVDADVVTPVALDVIDPAATTALKSSESARVPAIYRDYAADTNAVAAQFNAAFDTARSNFIAAVLDTYHTPTVDEKTATSDDFGYLITAFNIKNKDFPITSTLAMDWAYGKPGSFEKKMLLGALVTAAQRNVRPDELPDGFANITDARLVAPNQQGRLSGPVIAQSRLVTVSQARAAFRKAFTGYDEEPLAHVLCNWVKANCVPDAAATEAARQTATARLVVAEHYNAGQVIAPAGSVVDAKIIAAFDQLRSGQAPLSGTSYDQAPEPQMTAPAPAPRTQPTVAENYNNDTSAVQPPVMAQEKPVPATALSAFWHNALHSNQGVLELASISALAMFVFVASLVRRAMKRKPRPSLGTIQPMAQPARAVQPRSTKVGEASLPQLPVKDAQARELLEQIHAHMRAQELAQLQAEADARVQVSLSTQANIAAYQSAPAPQAHSPAPATVPQVPIPAELQTALAPQLVAAVREAMVQELAGQRRELLVVQHNAAVEVSRLVRRMDEMQIQLQERLKIYELQIARLETELAARTEENQELIRMKIEMIRTQRESEHTPDSDHAAMAFS